jgi:DNA-binding winged helix-turn-helix (wHTH) protein
VRVGFADCTIDLDTREVFRAGERVHLSPKGFLLLELLLEGRPRAFSKAEIHRKVWPDSFVSEATLASLVAEIREAIGDSSRDEPAIRTVHGFGYAFAAAASSLPPEPSPGNESTWRLVWADHETRLPEGETVLGRDSLATIRIPSQSVSRRHARIVVEGEIAKLEDLGSKNGTFVGGERVAALVQLRSGDSIRLGSVALTVRSDSQGSTDTEIEVRRQRRPSPSRRPARRRRKAMSRGPGPRR